MIGLRSHHANRFFLSVELGKNCSEFLYHGISHPRHSIYKFGNSSKIVNNDFFHWLSLFLSLSLSVCLLVSHSVTLFVCVARDHSSCAWPQWSFRMFTISLEKWIRWDDRVCTSGRSTISGVDYGFDISNCGGCEHMHNRLVIAHWILFAQCIKLMNNIQTKLTHEKCTR